MKTVIYRESGTKECAKEKKPNYTAMKKQQKAASLPLTGTETINISEFSKTGIT